MSNFQKNIKKIVLLTLIVLNPYLSNGQCTIIDTVIVKGFCWGSTSPIGTLTIVPLFNTTYNYALNADSSNLLGLYGDTVVLCDTLAGILFNNPLDSVFTVSVGTYTIWLQEADNPGCVDSITITIPDPQDPITTVTNVSQNLICNGDSTGGGEVNAIGGVLPYTYFWESTDATTNSVSNLWAGYHNVTVTDANGCSVIDSVSIENIYDPFSVDLDTIQQVQCYGECNGEVVLNINSGGVAPYTFNWSTGQNYLGSSSDTLSGLCQGGYQVLIKDAYGCDTTVSFIISEPSQLYALSSSIQPVQCFGFDDGMAYVVGVGGTGTGNTGDYNYSWSFIQNYDTPVAVTISSIVNVNTHINLVPGVHIASVTDTNGCTASDTVLITEPTQLYVDIPDSSAIYSYCLNTYTGALVAQAYGGIPNYNYSWDNTVQLSDSVYNLHAGIYTVTVFDDRACTASATFDLDSITNTFIPDSVDFNVTDVSCYGLYDGSISINSIAGSQYPPYSYNWNGPSPFTSINSPLLNGLYHGYYAVTIEDGKGCAMIFDADIDQPNILQYGVDYIINESCVGTTGSSCDGSIVVNINGGTSPYFYDNLFSPIFPIANQATVSNDTLLSGFCNGTYDIYITDSYGCQGFLYPGAIFIANVGSAVQVVNPGVIPFSPTTSCFNLADGMASVHGGPDPIFNYTWESNNSGSPSGSILGIGGTYNDFLIGSYWLVTHYSDAASFGINYSACDVSSNFIVSPGNMIYSGAVVTNPTCYGDTDGAISLFPSGNAPSFTILWDTLSSIPPSAITEESLVQLSAGVYTVSITDADGCVLVEPLTVNEPNPIVANLTVNDVTCNGFADGTVEVLVDENSGQAPFTYSWSNGSFANPAVGLSGGDYLVTVTDSNGLGCSIDFNVTIIDPSPILSSVTPNSFWGEDGSGSAYHIRCSGGSSGSIVAGSVGGTGPITFDWKNSLNITVSMLQETGAILPADSYTLEVKDANGCIENTNIILNEPGLIVPNITDTLYDFDGDGIGTEVSCYGSSDGWALSSPEGGYTGTQGYLYNWVSSNGQSISSQALATNLTALASYTVTITDMNGCFKSESTSVFAQPQDWQPDVTSTNYAGTTHAPFSVDFLDNTSLTDPFYFNWTWNDGVDSFPSGTTIMSHTFSTDNIGLNEVNVVLTNTTTGCIKTVFFDINVQGVPEINNVFTPNADGVNDEFFFGEFGMNTVSIEFYNRWGQMVYAWDGIDKSWRGVDISGEAVAEGVYFYSLAAEGEDGYNYVEKGSVTLLR